MFLLDLSGLFSNVLAEVKGSHLQMFFILFNNRPSSHPSDVKFLVCVVLGPQKYLLQRDLHLLLSHWIYTI